MSSCRAPFHSSIVRDRRPVRGEQRMGATPSRQPVCRVGAGRGGIGILRSRSRATSERQPAPPAGGKCSTWRRSARWSPPPCRTGRPGLRRPSHHVRPARRAHPSPGVVPARPGPRLPHRARRPRPHESGQDHLALYLYNGNEYLEGMLGALQGPGRAVQRQLPLRRGGAALPADRLAGRGRSSTTRRSRRRSPRSAPSCPTLDGADPGRRRVGQRRCCPAPSTTRSALAGVDPDRPAVEPLARRPLHPLHGRHDRHAQGRAVAPGRHLPGRHGRPDRRHRHEWPTVDDDRRRRRAATAAPSMMPSPPFMHGAAQWAGVHRAHAAATRRHARRHANARRRPTCWRLVERERSTIILVVGDAFGRPLLDELETRRLRPRSCCSLVNGGAALTPRQGASSSSCCPTC